MQTMAQTLVTGQSSPESESKDDLRTVSTSRRSSAPQGQALHGPSSALLRSDSFLRRHAKRNDHPVAFHGKLGRSRFFQQFQQRRSRDEARSPRLRDPQSGPDPHLYGPEQEREGSLLFWG